jgi:hypothetical protein
MRVLLLPLLGFSLLVAGCPGREAVPDAPGALDAPGLDAPGLDARRDAGSSDGGAGVTDGGVTDGGGVTDAGEPDACVPGIELCNGLDDDCDPGTPDGADDPGVGAPCDGADTDLCREGTAACVTGALACSDTTGSTVELCNGADDDCDPASADGSEDPGVGATCDGADTDLCVEGSRACVTGALTCSDTTGSTVDLCNGADDDCDPASTDGAEDPALGAACDGADADLCLEGARVCRTGALACSDATGDALELCNGADDDCDPATPDGADEPLLGMACDGPDRDRCSEGTRLCSTGAMRCTDTTGDTLDLCDGLDNDCDPGTADGADEPGLGAICDGSDLDLCVEGMRACSGGTLVCSDTTSSTSEVCNGLDDDCNASTADGSGELPPTCGGCTPACSGGGWFCSTVVTLGPVAASMGLDDPAVGTRTWDSPGNILASDGGSSSITSGRAYVSAMTRGEISHYLVAQGFGLAIPAGARIDGIRVDIERTSLSGIGIADSAVRLRRAGVTSTLGTANRAATGTWSTTETVVGYGGATDLWGEAWTPADLNRADFGVALSVRYAGSAGNDWAGVDQVRLTVYYSLPCP